MTSAFTRFTLAASLLAGVAVCGAQSTSTVVLKSSSAAGDTVAASQDLKLHQDNVSKAAANPAAAYQENLDLNRDGAVNNLDVILARRASAGPATSPSN